MARINEDATETVTVKASPQLLAEMEGGWSHPVQVLAERSPRGEWSLLFRTWYRPDGSTAEEEPHG